MVSCISRLIIWGSNITSGSKLLLHGELNGKINSVSDSYPCLKRAAFFSILATAVNHLKFKMLIFLAEFNMWQSHLAEKAALTCCLLGRCKAIQGPKRWLHRGSAWLSGLECREGVTPPRSPGGSQMLCPGGLPSLWSSLRRVPLSPPVPFPRAPAAASIVPGCIWWGVVIAPQWTKQTWSRRMRGEAGLLFPNESIRGELWEGFLCRQQINRQKRFCI